MNRSLITLHEVDPLAAADLSTGGTGGFTWISGGPAEGTRVGAGLVAKAAAEGAYVPGWGVYVIVRAEDGIAVGAIGFHGAPAEGRVELGYDLVEGARGFGYATEALRALAVRGLASPWVSTLVARTEPGNVASQRVLERVGFVRVGVTEEELTYELAAS